MQTTKSFTMASQILLKRGFYGLSSFYLRHQTPAISSTRSFMNIENRYVCHTACQKTHFLQRNVVGDSKQNIKRCLSLKSKIVQMNHLVCPYTSGYMTNPLLMKFTYGYQQRSFSTSRKLLETSDTHETKHNQLGQVTPRVGIIYKCKICGSRNSHTFSKKAYEEGVVIVKCETCESKHLIADNLGWFKDVNLRNIEEILASKGEEVKKISDCDIPSEMLQGFNTKSE